MEVLSLEYIEHPIVWYLVILDRVNLSRDLLRPILPLHRV